MHFFTRLFPLWAMAFALFAYCFPSLFLPAKSGIVPLLCVIMFSMGLTLQWQDFTRVWAAPKAVMLCVFLQFSIMPLAAWLIALSFGFDAQLTAGMVLVGATAGGTASNVICFLGKGDVALSVTLTLVSTLVAVFATPLLTYMYLQTSVDVPLQSMLLSILKIVLLPLVAGLALSHLSMVASVIKRWPDLLPLVATLAIVLIIAIVVALNQLQIASMGLVVIGAVILHNSIGLLGGYSAARLIGLNRRTCRTIAIEVGMQNSGLSVALASQYFSGLAALPGAVFSVWHNISGSLLAAYWRGQADREAEPAVSGTLPTSR